MGNSICDRCGLTIGKHIDMHHKLCQRTPLPDDLVIEWRDNDVTQKDMCKKYGVSIAFLRRRMRPSPLYEQASASKRSWSAMIARMANGKVGKKDNRGKKCKCGILFAHPEAQPVKDGRCAMCVAEMNGRAFRDLNPVSLLDYRPFVPEYV